MKSNANTKILPSKIPITSNNLHTRSISTDAIKTYEFIKHKPLKVHFSSTDRPLNQSYFITKNKSMKKSCLKQSNYLKDSYLKEKEILFDFEMNEIAANFQNYNILSNNSTDINSNLIFNTNSTACQQKLLNRLNKVELSLLAMREDQALNNYNKKIANSNDQSNNVFKLMKKDDLGNQLARYNLGFKHIRKDSIDRLIINRSNIFKVTHLYL